MIDYPIAEATMSIYVSLLLALGQIGLGWFLAFRSQNMSGSVGAEKGNKSVLPRFLVIWGWALLIGGCACMAIFLFLVAVIAFQSFRF